MGEVDGVGEVDGALRRAMATLTPQAHFFREHAPDKDRRFARATPGATERAIQQRRITEDL